MSWGDAASARANRRIEIVKLERLSRWNKRERDPKQKEGKDDHPFRMAKIRRIKRSEPIEKKRKNRLDLF